MSATDSANNIVAARPYITIVSGAGASACAGASSTEELSNAVQALPLSKKIIEAIRSQSRYPDPLNFEDALFVLEELEAYLDPTSRLRAVRDMKPFFEWSAILRDIPADWRLFRKERFAVLELLHEHLSRINADGRQPLYRWLKPLAERYDLHWFTLNYDILADETINAISLDVDKKWYDGFDPLTLGFRPDQYPAAESVFGPIHLWLSHLHGSLLFGYRDMAPYYAHGAPLEIIRMRTPAEAIENWRIYHQSFVDGHDDDFSEGNIISPLLSGQRKIEKLYSQPYSNYFQAFASSLLGSPHLMLIGYGGLDFHINNWIDQYFRTHNDKTRVIEVTLGSGPQDSVTSMLTRMQLVNTWQNVAPGTYVSRYGVPAMVVLTGVTDEAPPTELMIQQLEGRFATLH
jgi:hypothetical protein